jgi:ribosomal protein S18 acetylase RimI-like enzyme
VPSQGLPGLEIRDLTEAEAAEIHEAMPDLVRASDNFSLCAALARRRIGYLIVQSMGGGAFYIQNLEVHLDHRRRGVASELLKEMLRRLGTGHEITLGVDPDNVAAVSLYKQHGFAFIASHGRPRMMVRAPSV